MNSSIFRKSSIDRVNSPEQLNEYIRVANPSVWMTLGAVVILLLGVIIWGIFGSVNTTVSTGVQVEQGAAVCYVAAEDAGKLAPGQTITAGDITGTILSIPEVPMQVDESFADYMLYLTGFSLGDFCYAVEVSLPGAADGISPAVITVDSIRPIAFVIH